MTARRGPLAGLPREVSALVAVAFMVAVGFGVVAPAIAPFAKQFGVSRAAASGVISAFALARLVTAPFVGRLVNLAGERILLGVGIGIVAVSSALAGLSQTYWQLLLLRGIGGVGSIMFSVSSASLLYRVTPPALRGRAQGAYAGGFLLGSIFGPAFGVITAWSLRAPFFLYAATLTIAGTLALRTLRHSVLAAPQRSAPPAVSLREALGRPAYRAALAANMSAQWSVVGVRSALVPLFVLGPLSLNHNWNYAAFFLVSVVSGALLTPFGRQADANHRLGVIAVGLVAAAAGLLVLPAWASASGLLAGMALLGVAGAALSVAPGAMVGDIVGTRGGTVVAAFAMAGDAGSVAGPVIAGWLADRYGFGTSFVVAAVVAVIPLVFLVAARGDPAATGIAGRSEVVAGGSAHTPGDHVGDTLETLTSPAPILDGPGPPPSEAATGS